jgi:hypothetical protein
MFPGGIAGFALLVLRFSAAGMLLISAFPGGDISACPLKALAIFAVSGVLCLGVFTPAVCVLPILVEAATLPQLGKQAAANTILHILVTASLLILGPGAYSVDARIFGRRLIQPPRLD